MCSLPLEWWAVQWYSCSPCFHCIALENSRPRDCSECLETSTSPRLICEEALVSCALRSAVDLKRRLRYFTHMHACPLLSALRVHAIVSMHAFRALNSPIGRGSMQCFGGAHASFSPPDSPCGPLHLMSPIACASCASTTVSAQCPHKKLRCVCGLGFSRFCSWSRPLIDRP